jgi:integrase
MTKHNANNERIKRKYFIYLRQAKQQSVQAVDGAASALARFENQTKHRDFKMFHSDLAIAFKKHLAEQVSKKSGEKLSKATMYATLTSLKSFFQWLSRETGYKSRIHYSDAEFFNMSSKDARVATTRRVKAFPTLEQVKRVITMMPADTAIERRNRALIAFTLLTGARVGAIASMKLIHIDLAGNNVYQDARTMNTKFSKSFFTFFFPVGDKIRQIVVEWVTYLKKELYWGNDDPLFPAPRMAHNAACQYEAVGLEREHWSTTSPIRKIFRDAFASAGFQYYNPHCFRDTLTQHGIVTCQKDAEALKAWSQNLGHDGVLTTLLNYGQVATARQGEIMQRPAKPQDTIQSNADEIAELVVRKMRDAGAERLQF